MNQSTLLSFALICLIVPCVVSNAQAPAAAPYVPEDHRPPLFLREDWKHPGPGDPVPLSQAAIITPNVDVRIYGETRQSPAGKHDAAAPGHGGVEVAQRLSPKDDPTFIYMGPCFTPCAVALRDRNNYVDLTGLAKVHWRTKQTGYHDLRPIVKLADGTWLVGDHREGASTDWLVSEFSFVDVRWHLLNIDKVVTTKTSEWVDKPDLSKVDEVGFTDLMPGNAADGGHGTAGTSRVDWIEVYGRPVKR